MTLPKKSRLALAENSFDKFNYRVTRNCCQIFDLKEKCENSTKTTFPFIFDSNTTKLNPKRRINLSSFDCRIFFLTKKLTAIFGHRVI
jgi:hypothetical protein